MSEKANGCPLRELYARKLDYFLILIGIILFFIQNSVLLRMARKWGEDPQRPGLFEAILWNFGHLPPIVIFTFGQTTVVPFSFDFKVILSDFCAY